MLAALLILACQEGGGLAVAEDAAAVTSGVVSTNGALPIAVSLQVASVETTTDGTPPPNEEVAAAGVIAAAVPLDDSEPLTTTVNPLPAPGFSSDFGLATPDGDAKKDDAEAQRHLETNTPAKVIADHGVIGFLIRNPEPRNLLEVINPFAPDEFGPADREVYNRDPNLSPGAILPRTFINDIIHEPVLSLWNWAW